MITKNIYLDDRSFVSTRNFTTEHVIVVKSSRIFLKLLKFKVFSGFQIFFNPVYNMKRAAYIVFI